jgi:hypothetical protein
MVTPPPTHAILGVVGSICDEKTYHHLVSLPFDQTMTMSPPAGGLKRHIPPAQKTKHSFSEKVELPRKKCDLAILPNVHTYMFFIKLFSPLLFFTF